MKAYWGSGGIAPRILKLGARWRFVVSFKLRGRFIPELRDPDTHLIGGWVVGLHKRSGRDGKAKRKIS